MIAVVMLIVMVTLEMMEVLSVKEMVALASTYDSNVGDGICNGGNYNGNDEGGYRVIEAMSAVMMVVVRW